MTNKANHAKYLCGIRDAVQGSTDEVNLPFIIGSLGLYEECYGSQNKESFRKFLNDALSVYGPGTQFESDDRVLPLYIMLGKYSRSSTPAEIFDRMSQTGAYRSSARFYTEWSNVFIQAGHSTKAKEILAEGLKRKAKPDHMIVTALKELGYSLDENNVPRTTKKRTPSSKFGSARKQLFPKDKTPIKQNTVLPSLEFVLPTLPSNCIDPSQQAQTLPTESLIDLPNFTANENQQPHHDSSDSERSEDAENLRPPGEPQRSLHKRKTAGILVPAAGFQLEDYDLYSNDDEDEKKINEKEEANRKNIENNFPMSPVRRPVLPMQNTSSAPVPSPRRQMFPVVLPEPVLPRCEPTSTTMATTMNDSEFRNGHEALKNLRPDSDDEDSENEPRRLTGFEKLLQKRKSWGTRQSLAEKATKSKQEPLDELFSRMGMNSPSTSKS